MQQSYCQTNNEWEAPASLKKTNMASAQNGSSLLLGRLEAPAPPTDFRFAPIKSSNGQSRELSS